VTLLFCNSGGSGCNGKRIKGQGRGIRARGREEGKVGEWGETVLRPAAIRRRFSRLRKCGKEWVTEKGFNTSVVGGSSRKEGATDSCTRTHSLGLNPVVTARIGLDSRQ